MTAENDKTPLWHHLPAAEAVSLLDVDVSAGLSPDELKKRQQVYSKNQVTARHGASVWRKFFQQFNQPLVYILLVAVAVTAALGEWVDASVIFTIVFFNAVVGFLQESK
ncbi:MAG: cation-transporting P-type ATPase, partial [Luteolibacter sp.]